MVAVIATIDPDIICTVRSPAGHLLLRWPDDPNW